MSWPENWLVPAGGMKRPSKEYEAVLRTFIRKKQRGAERLASVLAPKDSMGSGFSQPGNPRVRIPRNCKACGRPRHRRCLAAPRLSLAIFKWARGLGLENAAQSSPAEPVFRRFDEEPSGPSGFDARIGITGRAFRPRHVIVASGAIHQARLAKAAPPGCMSLGDIGAEWSLVTSSSMVPILVETFPQTEPHCS